MKYLAIIFTGIILASCGTKVPFTRQVQDEFGLDSSDKMKKVQFYTSATIKLESKSSSGDSGTNDDGTLVSSSSENQDLVIIPIGTQCVFEGMNENGDISVRFEVGAGNFLTFELRGDQPSSKFYLQASWSNKRGTLEYGNKEYTAVDASSTAYLMVMKKNLKKVKRDARVVKGMKV